jgi:hypothetical protein
MAAAGGMAFLGLLVIGLVLLVMLFVAPLKLYGIHREMKLTNDLLLQQIGVLAQIEALGRAQSYSINNLTTRAQEIVACVAAERR